VNTHVLIPRLETEVLIKRARKILQSSKEDTTNKTLTIDIGCGSGIIGTSVADLSTDIIFLDISEEALTVARQNFAAHFPTKKAKFIVSDLLSCFFLGHSTPLPPLKGGLLKENPLKGKLREL
jgi:release factor glutamine methyltransferase